MSTPIVVAQTTFSAEYDARDYEKVSFFCTGLGANETVAIEQAIAGAWVALKAFDPSGATNNVVSFTGSLGVPASVDSVTVVGHLYRFVAAGLAGPVSITAMNGRYISEG